MFFVVVSSWFSIVTYFSLFSFGNNFTCQPYIIDFSPFLYWCLHLLMPSCLHLILSLPNTSLHHIFPGCNFFPRGTFLPGFRDHQMKRCQCNSLRFSLAFLLNDTEVLSCLSPSPMSTEVHFPICSYAPDPMHAQVPFYRCIWAVPMARLDVLSQLSQHNGGYRSYHTYPEHIHILITGN